MSVKLFGSRIDVISHKSGSSVEWVDPNAPKGIHIICGNVAPRVSRVRDFGSLLGPGDESSYLCSVSSPRCRGLKIIITFGPALLTAPLPVGVYLLMFFWSSASHMPLSICMYLISCYMSIVDVLTSFPHFPLHP